MSECKDHLMDSISGDQMSRPEKPAWLKIKANVVDDFKQVRRTLANKGLRSVCDSAHCPNQTTCWSHGHVTMMILGTTCTRNCGFCAVDTAQEGDPVMEDEPQRIAEAVSDLGLKHVVITSVTRDDLPDQGAGHFASTVKKIKELTPSSTIELLIPDFQGREDLIRKVVDSHPNVIGHNIETVERLQKRVRDKRCAYERSISVLKAIKEIDRRIITKSSLMLGLGETREEVLDSLVDLKLANVDLITIGQYLRPRSARLDVQSYIPPDDFLEWEFKVRSLGFKGVMSGPFVRSSYLAGDQYSERMRTHAY